MDWQSENSHLRELVQQYERDSQRAYWLLGRLSDKVRHFPRDLARRIRRSRRKRQGFPENMPVVSPLNVALPPETVLEQHRYLPRFAILDGRIDELAQLRKDDVASDAMLREMENFSHSRLMRELTEKAAAIEPEVGIPTSATPAFCAPWHDGNYETIRLARRLIPEGPFDAVILVPFGKMGGADLVAGILARAVAEEQRILILRTDAADWDRPDWYPDSVPTVDLSAVLKGNSDPQRMLYVLLNEIAPSRIFNVNSRLAFDTFVRFGNRLAYRFDLYAYFFCADRTAEGVEVGYPVWYFAPIFPHLRAALIDTANLANTLIERFALPPDLAKKVHVLYTPALTPAPDILVAEHQFLLDQHGRRPHVLWAGRLDRQKRFDLVAAIAEAMPDVDFSCWGKAVLDAPPDLSRLPRNVVINPPFASYDDLPLARSDGFLYTSAWDGLPTILIELGALGVPIVASAVGGVPELIDRETGWPVPGDSGPEAYVAALREMIGDPKARIARGKALQSRVRERHVMATYRAKIGQT